MLDYDDGATKCSKLNEIIRATMCLLKGASKCSKLNIQNGCNRVLDEKRCYHVLEKKHHHYMRESNVWCKRQ